jgi:hypothetical protein
VIDFARDVILSRRPGDFVDLHLVGIVFKIKQTTVHAQEMLNG